MRTTDPDVKIAAANGAARLVVVVLAGLAIVAGGGCVSNPTPHPAQDALSGGDPGRTGDESTNAAAPSDPEGCDAVGGFWTGEDCQTDADLADALTDAPETEADGGDGGADLENPGEDGQDDTGPSDADDG